MNLPEFSVKRSVTTMMVFFAVVLVGSFCITRTPIDLFPEMDVPMITVITPYEGVGPEDIEEKITQPLEEALALVEDVEHIYSTSQAGASIIRLSFAWQTNLDSRANDIRDAIDSTQEFLPEEADDTRIFKFDVSQFPIMVYGVHATRSYENLEQILDDELADPLESIKGVASVRTIIPLRRQVNVDVDREKLASYDMILSDVVAAVNLANQEISSGSIKMGYTDYLPRVPGEFDEVEPMNDIVVKARNGNLVRLRDIGEASDGFKEIQQYVQINGNPGAIVLVSKQSDANTVEVAREVKKRIPELQANLPRDIEVINVMDSSEDIIRSVRDLVQTLLIGGGLAMVAVLIFLRRVRATLIIGLAIPFSVILAAAMIYFVGYSINMITLFAFIVAIGMVVDNAIVVLENITRHREEGESAAEGAVYGASEVGMAITASTLTTLSVFFPLIFVRGIAQILFTPFAVVAGVLLLASLFSALTLTPMLASRLLASRKSWSSEEKGMIYSYSERAFDALAGGYANLLDWCLGHRILVIFVALALLGLSVCLAPAIGWEFFPKEDRGLIRGKFQLPVGTRVEKTSEAMEAVTRMLRETIPAGEIESTFANCGTDGSGFDTNQGRHIGEFGASLIPRDERKGEWHVTEMADKIRAEMDKLAGVYAIEDYNLTLQDPMQALLSGSEQPLSVSILGDNMDVTNSIARELEKRVKKVPGTVDITISREEGAPELWVDVDRTKASSIGLSMADIARAVRNGMYGQVASRFRSKGEEYDVRVRLREADRQTEDDLGLIPVRLPQGSVTRINNAATIQRSRGPVQIERKDQRRVVRVEGDVSGRSLGEAIEDVNKIIAEMDIPQGVSIEMGGQSEDIRESFFWLTLALVVGIILVYMVMASQFESVLHPFVVMFSLPFAFVGVALALVLGGDNLSIVVFLGMLMLVGVVVNNAIVLVDYINILRARGRSMNEAIREAGRARLRPVLMTAFTTILALVPMAVRGGQGAEVWNPLGMTILGGLLVATLVTLIIVPVMYSILERAKEA